MRLRCHDHVQITCRVVTINETPRPYVVRLRSAFSVPLCVSNMLRGEGSYSALGIVSDSARVDIALARVRCLDSLQPSGHYMYRTVVTICTAQWSLYVPHSGHYMYRQFNIQQLYVLPTQCIYVFCVDLRTNSHYFPIQH